MESGFVVSCQSGDVQFDVLGEESCADKSLITFSAADHLAACVMGRLYYRGDLAGQIGMAAATAGSLSAADLVVAAHKALGDDAFQKIEGEFAIVLLDRRRRLMFAWRDPIGGFPLFWASGKDAVHVSTSLRTLNQMRPAGAINLDYVADYLMLPSPFEQEVYSQGTIHEGIRRVQAGTLVTFKLGTGQVDQKRLIDWATLSSDYDKFSYDDVVSHYRELFRESVETRTIGRVGCHFSGGMDSTSVGLLAHAKLAGAGDPLRTYTMTYENLPGQKQEDEYIAAARAAAPGAIHASLPGDDWYDFGEFGSDTYQDEPCGTIWQSAMSTRTVRRAADDGVDTLLTGFGGEEFISTSPYYIADLISKGQYAKAWSETGRLAQARGRSRMHYIWNGGLSELMPKVSRPSFGGQGKVPWAKLTDEVLPPWIHRDFADKHRLLERHRANTKAMTSGAATPTMAMLLFALRYRTGDTLRWTLGTQSGVFQAHPYIEPRIIRFCMAVQDRMPAIIDRQKAILGDAMAGTLPDLIRLRQEKGHFTEVVYRGLARNVGTIERVASSADTSRLDIFDLDSLIECLHQSAAGVVSMGSKRLRLSLYLLKWLGLEKAVGTKPLSRRQEAKLGLAEQAA